MSIELMRAANSLKEMRQRAEAAETELKSERETESFTLYTLRAERDAVVNERTELCKTVAFFASVIKSGEPWSDTCQTMYNNTIIHLPSRK